MKIITFTASKVPCDIIATQITGYTPYGIDQTFIATGADNADGGENGWIVDQSFDEVRAIVKAFNNE